MGSEKIKIIVIFGPTCSGKSSLALSLAHQFDCEIISADSRQIYRQLKIGTDRLDENQWQGIAHHLMGSHDLDYRFTAFDFVDIAERAIREASARGRHVIICGGTGLYIRALVQGIYELPDGDVSYRNELLDLAASKGPKFIHDMLVKVDPEEAAQVHYNNMIRVIRALEIYNLTGRPKSKILKDTAPRNDDFVFLQINLNPPRDELYNLIDARVDKMFEDGLLQEAEAVWESTHREALKDRRIVGYSELIEYFEDRISLEEAKNLTKQNTRRYAKRQYTWLKGVKQAEVISGFGKDALAPCLKLAGSFWS